MCRSRSPEAAALLVKAMHQIADMAPVIMPVHPRGRAVFEAAGLAKHPGIRMCEPLGYLEFMSLVRGAAAAITDSAGVQEETTFLRVPCLTLRPVTERPVTVTSGSNRSPRPGTRPATGKPRAAARFTSDGQGR
jgi:UDP-N-acetylglucosamine 2-epimerase (non-hydrolysing)